MTAPVAIPDENHLTQVGRVLTDHFNALVRHHTAAKNPEGFAADLVSMLQEIAAVSGLIIVKCNTDPESVVEEFAESMLDAIHAHREKMILTADGDYVVFPPRN